MKKLLRFTVYIKPCIPQLAAAIIFGALFGLCSGFGMPVIFDKVLRKIFMEKGGEEQTFWYIVGIAMLLPTIFALRAIFGYLSGYLMTYTSLEVLRRLKQDIFQKIQGYPIAFFEKFTSGDLLTRLTSDTVSVQTVLLSFSSEIFRQPLQVVGALGFLLYLCYTKGQVVFLLIFLAAVPFCILPVQMIRKNMKRFAGKAQVRLSDMAQLFGENLDAAHEVRVFSLQEPQIEKFDGMNKEVKWYSLKMAKYELMQQPFMEFLAASMVSVTFVYAYFGDIDFPTFSAIGIALYFTIDPLKRVIRMCTDFVKIMPLIERIRDVLDYETTVPEPLNPVKIGRVKGMLTFSNVDFAYNNKTVLKNVNIEIPAGTSCALVGASGAGKSTFARLAMRLYDPVSGSIKIDGVNLRDISSKDFMENLGSVPQYPVLFNDTVYNNILLAKPDAAKEEIVKAAKMAYAHEFIEGLDEGYDTVVGERGDRLSGGQKQRIALARVFLKNPPFIVLDEATSALDVNSEAFIQKAVDSLMKDRTMLIIAHRFSTIRNVRKIIVFHEGEIIDFGSHDELIGRCAEYRRLYEKQNSK
jgi:ABC transporter related